MKNPWPQGFFPRSLPSLLRILGLITALLPLQACKEREQLEKEAPALARADLRVDRIAIAGVVSDTPALGDSAESREHWSLLMGNHLAKDEFGKLPILASSEMMEILGRDDYDLMLDRFKDDGECGGDILSALGPLLEGKARFVVFGNIVEDQVTRSESESEVVDPETKKVISKTKTRKTVRTTTVRLRFYDLRDQQLAWDHLTIGEAVATKNKDMSDVIEHGEKEGFLGGLLTSIANSALKPDPKYPQPHGVDKSLQKAFDNVGPYLKPGKKK